MERHGRAQQLVSARTYVERARAAHMQVLLHISTDDYTIKKAKLPSVATYRQQIGRIVSYFRALGVREFGTWDEVNHASQPTWDSPSHAALFFREMYRAVKPRCPTCGVVALDVLDQTGVERYMQSFYRPLSPTYHSLDCHGRSQDQIKPSGTISDQCRAHRTAGVALHALARDVQGAQIDGDRRAGRRGLTHAGELVHDLAGEQRPDDA
jgi:hypothetical protein